MSEIVFLIQEDPDGGYTAGWPKSYSTWGHEFDPE
jgi:hypothetical protein